MNIINMPYSIKLIIMNYLPINMLIIDDPPQMIYDHIIHYINTKLLTNMHTAGLLLINNIYKDIVYDKLDKISQNIANKFMKAVDDIGGPIKYNNETMPIISLKIIFKFTKVGKFYKGDTSDIKYCISSYGIYDNYCTWFYNYKYNTFEYKNENIKNEIYRILIKNMDLSDTIVDINSMEIIKTNLSETENNILYKLL